MRWGRVVLLLAGLALGACGSAVPAAPMPTPTVSLTPTIAVLSPAQAAAALATEQALTPTPTPTLAPEPTTTAVPTPRPTPVPMTDDQRLYLVSLEQKSVDIYDSVRRFSLLMGELDRAPTLMQDATWRGKVNAELSFWRTTYSASKGSTAPQGLGAVNAKWIEAAGHMNQAADDLTQGLSQDDGRLVDSAYLQIDQMATNLDQLGQLVDTFNASHGSPLPPAPSSTALVRPGASGVL
ncbi:MAG TPA: hypothetical protein VFN57_14975 [Thermomicrobiaceae bacterium]|nr:hypothetical protein [Thermomicrobiaceae bacterium]